MAEEHQGWLGVSSQGLCIPHGEKSVELQHGRESPGVPGDGKTWPCGTYSFNT